MILGMGVFIFTIEFTFITQWINVKRGKTPTMISDIKLFL